MQCKNAKNKAKNSINYTLGRKHYRRVVEDMTNENPNEQITRTMVWKATHKRKSREVLPSAAGKYALIEATEEKQKLKVGLNGDGMSNLYDIEHDPIAENFGSNKKKNYCRAISSSSSAKQIKMTQTTKTIANNMEREDLNLFKTELINEISTQVASQVNEMLQSFASTFTSRLMNMLPGLQQNQFGSNSTPRSEDTVTQKGSPMNNVANSIVPIVDVSSSRKGKQYVMLLSRDLEKEVAKGYLSVQSTCHFRKVIPNVETVVYVKKVIDPDAPIYDGPRDGNSYLCDVVKGGYLIWPLFRVRSI